MNILMVFPYLTGHGGMETVIGQVLGTKQPHNNIRLFLPGGCKDKTWLDNFESSVILHHKKNIVTMFFDTLLFILKEEPDIVISMNKIQIVAAWLAKIILKKKLKLVSWNHFSINETKFKFALKVFQLCDYHLAISSGIQRQLISIGIPKEKIFLIFNPIAPVSKTIRRTSTNEVKKFIYVGRLQYEKQKNLSELINILSSVKQYKWRLSVIGTGDDLMIIQRFAEEKGIAERITWQGWQASPWENIKSADLLFLTSKFEGFPMILTEAMSYGVPCFSADCPTGPEDIIKNRLNGSLYESGNINQAHDILSAYFENRINYLSPQKIKQTIENMYTPRYLERLNAILDEVFKSE